MNIFRLLKIFTYRQNREYITIKYSRPLDPSTTVSKSGKRQPSQEEIRKFEEEIHKSSQVNHTSGLFFILTLIYAISVVNNTTDLQLLLPNKDIVLPIFGFKISVIDFYRAIPVLIVQFHFALLFYLYSHKRKIEIWTQQFQELQGEWIGTPYMFNYLFMRPEGKRHINLFFLSSFKLFYGFFLPLFTLFFIQITFARYQSISITLLHTCLILIDIGMLFFFWSTSIRQPTCFATFLDGLQRAFPAIKEDNTPKNSLIKRLNYFYSLLVQISAPSEDNKIKNLSTHWFNYIYLIFFVGIIIFNSYNFLNLYKIVESNVNDYYPFRMHLRITERPISREDIFLNERTHMDYSNGKYNRPIIEKRNFKFAFIDKVLLEELTFREIDFFGATFSHVQLHNTGFQDVDFTCSTMANFSLKVVELKNVCLDSMNLVGVEKIDSIKIIKSISLKGTKNREQFLGNEEVIIDILPKNKLLKDMINEKINILYEEINREVNNIIKKNLRNQVRLLKKQRENIENPSKLSSSVKDSLFKQLLSELDQYANQN